MKLDDLEKLAGGQVYTGRVAKRNGLVDDIGTLRDAIQAAKRLAGLDADEKYELQVPARGEEPAGGTARRRLRGREGSPAQRPRRPAAARPRASAARCDTPCNSSKSCASPWP